ncbi:MAG: YbhB/YbcL family Raf kinase inhibitor-like protein [Patescibacteria group bacterium]|nr:YbhB/YbcL family Raf kinase inhibitor-like protein [Patescibacteria group bacterium]
MKITSPVFQNNESIPKKYSCDGENINPPLEIADVPESAKSLVLVVVDPDAPVAGGFAHWTLWNISSSTSQITENSVPERAIQGLTSSNSNGYVSPCPPSGTHRYFFKLYALDTNLDLPSSSKREDVEKAMEGHILDQAELIGLYQRQ